MLKLFNVIDADVFLARMFVCSFGVRAVQLDGPANLYLMPVFGATVVSAVPIFLMVIKHPEIVSPLLYEISGQERAVVIVRSGNKEGALTILKLSLLTSKEPVLPPFKTSNILILNLSLVETPVVPVVLNKANISVGTVQDKEV